MTMTPASPGKLSLVATPIGNLEDITLRALRILREAQVIYAEDTRHTAILLNHHGIRAPLQSCHDFSEEHRIAEILNRIRDGKPVALVSDAGTPGISDPGFRVVRACVQAGLTVEVIPGPCAAIAALSGSGLPTDEFHFAGFLPVKKGACEKRLRALGALPGTQLIYESPHRLLRTLEMIAEIFPDRRVAVARELTKKFEEFIRGTPAEVRDHFQKNQPRGEMVVLLDPPKEG